MKKNSFVIILVLILFVVSALGITIYYFAPNKDVGVGDDRVKIFCDDRWVIGNEVIVKVKSSNPNYDIRAIIVDVNGHGLDFDSSPVSGDGEFLFVLRVPPLDSGTFFVKVDYNDGLKDYTLTREVEIGNGLMFYLSSFSGHMLQYLN